MSISADKAAIRPAATVILVRHDGPEPAVLMGQRGAKAAFMADKFVFPGGALDPSDHHIALEHRLQDPCAARLHRCNHAPQALAAAALRELAEETGLLLGRPGRFVHADPPWAAFSRAGLAPDASALRLIFRAVTPPGRRRRFDAFFFMADARHVHGDIAHFADADGELSNLHWVTLSQALKLPIPFITEVVLAEVDARLRDDAPAQSVPFFDNLSQPAQFRRID